jgi:hypothetical protein
MIVFTSSLVINETVSVLQSGYIWHMGKRRGERSRLRQLRDDGPAGDPQGVHL